MGTTSDKQVLRQGDRWYLLVAEGKQQWGTSCYESVLNAAKQGTGHHLAQ